MEFNWNVPTQRFSKCQASTEGSEVQQERNRRKQLRQMKKDVVNEYMAFYNKLIDETIQDHNGKIYGDLNTFLETTTKKLEIARTKVADQSADKLGNLASNITKEQAS